MPDTTFYADDIIGHTLYANKPIPVYHDPYDSSVPYRTIPAGGYVGQVINFLQPSSYRTDFYWVINSAGYGQDYVRHHVGDYSIDALENAGVDTVQQQQQAAADQALKDASPIEYYLKKYGIWVVIAIVGAGAVSGIIKKHL
jgi:hypothetical protein